MNHPICQSAMRQTTDKPGSVVTNHLSSYAVASVIKRVQTACWRAASNQASLQPTGFTSSARHRAQL